MLRAGMMMSRAMWHTADAADFDGTNDYGKIAGQLAGISDTKEGTFSTWFRLDGGDGTNEFMFVIGDGAKSKARFQRQDSNKIELLTQDATVQNLNIKTTATFISGPTWYHLISSWDLLNSVEQIYIDDVSDVVVTTSSNTVIDYTYGNCTIGASHDGAQKFNGALFDLWFDTSHIDLSVEANRRKFISAGGKPVNLGADGSFPTGSQPFVFQHLDVGETADNFLANAGSGGGFTVNGALETASTSPTD